MRSAMTYAQGRNLRFATCNIWFEVGMPPIIHI